MSAALETQSGYSRGQALFKPLTLGIILAIGILCFGAFMTLSGFSDDLKNANNGRSHAASKSPNGFAGIVRLLSADGMDVELLRGEPPFWDDESTVVYTLPSPYVSESLGDLKAPGQQLFVLPKWRVGQHPRERGKYVRYGEYAAPIIADLLSLWDDYAKVHRAGASNLDPLLDLIISRKQSQSDLEAGPQPNGQSDDEIDSTFGLDMTDKNKDLNGRSVIQWDENSLLLDRVERLQTFQSNQFIPIIETQNGIVLGKLKNKPVYVLADPDLWNNYGVYDYDTAKLSLQIALYLNADYETLYFDLNLHGLGSSQNFLKTMLSPPFLAATLCLLFTGGLIGWSALTQFGGAKPSQRAYALGKTALADNSAELIKVAGREPSLASRYVDLTRNIAARKIGAPRGLSEEQLIETLDRVGKRSGTKDSLSGLTKRADKISQHSSLMALAKAVYKWKQEITNERE